MCGIVSIVSAAGAVDPACLKRATDALIHRGPDGEGFWISADRSASLGHRRLSIIDLATGAQPISNERGDIHITVNGEFYGHEDIRSDLQARGHVFKTSSDSEIALHLYEEYGDSCVDHLRGEFAFIIYDETKKRLFAARDRFGIKPLCWAEYQGAFYLASEAKAIIAAGVPAAWDSYSFYHAATMQYVPQDQTLFSGIHQLKPGHHMVVEKGAATIRPYWDMDYPVDSMAISEGDALDGFGHMLSESIRLRLRADVPVCCHLSGGLDSASVLGMASAIHGRPLSAFTVAFEEESYDEYDLAAEMAQRNGGSFHAIRLTQEDLVTHMPDAVYHGEGLAINGHLVGKFLLNRAIRQQGYKVALTGEGSDENLAGYPHLRQDLGGGAALYQSNQASLGAQLAFGDQLPLDAVRRKLGYVPAFLAAKASYGLRMQSLLSGDFRQKFGDRDIYADFIDNIAVSSQLIARKRVDQSLYLWNKTALANYILRTLGDGMEMSHSVEGRLPFLDHKLFEYARALPLDMKIRNGVEKYILRETAKPYITERIYKREKHPFMAPPVSAFSNQGLDLLINDTLNSNILKNLPFFDAGAVRTQWKNLRHMSRQEQIAWEPVMMTVLTACFIGERFRLNGAV